MLLLITVLEYGLNVNIVLFVIVNNMNVCWNDILCYTHSYPWNKFNLSLISSFKICVIQDVAISLFNPEVHKAKCKYDPIINKWAYCYFTKVFQLMYWWTLIEQNARSKASSQHSGSWSQKAVVRLIGFVGFLDTNYNQLIIVWG